jgi:hypothetical protein
VGNVRKQEIKTASFPHKNGFVSTPSNKGFTDQSGSELLLFIERKEAGTRNKVAVEVKMTKGSTV